MSSMSLIEQIEVVPHGRPASLRQARRRGDPVPLPPQAQVEVSQHVGIVLDQEDPDGRRAGTHGSGRGAGRKRRRRRGGRRGGPQLEPEGGAPALARAGGRQPAPVRLGHRTADRQAQPQAAPPVRALARLLERVEDPVEEPGFDPDPRVLDLHHQEPATRVEARSGFGLAAVHRPGIEVGADGAGVRVVRADPHRPAARGELGRVTDQVPEELHQPREVGLSVVLLGREVLDDLQAGLGDQGGADLQGAGDHRVDVDPRELQAELAAPDPRDVEQVVDQAGLERDVAAHHLQVLAEPPGTGQPHRGAHRRPAAPGSTGCAARD